MKDMTSVVKITEYEASILKELASDKLDEYADTDKEYCEDLRIIINKLSKIIYQR